MITSRRGAEAQRRGVRRDKVGICIFDDSRRGAECTETKRAIVFLMSHAETQSAQR